MSIVTNLQICVDLHWCGKLDFSSQFFSLFSIRLWYSQTCVLWLCSTFYQRRQNVIGICEKSSLYYLAVKISKTVTFNNLKAKNKKQKQKQKKYLMNLKHWQGGSESECGVSGQAAIHCMWKGPRKWWAQKRIGQFVGKAKRECGRLEIPAAVEVINKIIVLFPISKRENWKMPCIRKTY